MTTGFTRALNTLGPRRAMVAIVLLVLSIHWLWIAVWFGVLPVDGRPTSRLGGAVAGDFMFFYSAARLTADGQAGRVYDADALTDAGRGAFGPKVPELVWPYPPTLSVPLAVLGRLDVTSALIAWIGISLTSLLLVGRLALGDWRQAPLVLLFPASAFALFTGQISSVLALLLALVVRWSRQSPTMAGGALGLLAWKPHFAVVPLLNAVFERPRLAAAAAATFTAVAIVSIALFGTAPWMAFFAGGLRHAGALGAETPMARFVSHFGLAYVSGAPLAVAVALHLVGSAVGATAGLWLWRRGSFESVRAFGLIGATIQVTPYALDYDLVLFLLPWALMLRDARTDDRAASDLFWPWVVLTVLVPSSYFSSLYAGRSPAGPIVLALLVYVWRREAASAQAGRRLSRQDSMSSNAVR